MRDSDSARESATMQDIANLLGVSLGGPGPGGWTLRDEMKKHEREQAASTTAGAVVVRSQGCKANGAISADASAA
jgi:hypothetical protein